MKSAVLISVLGAAAAAGAVPRAGRADVPSFPLRGARARSSGSSPYASMPRRSRMVRNVDTVTPHHVSMKKVAGRSGSRSGPPRQWHKSFRRDLSDGWDLLAADASNSTGPATTNMTFLYNSQYVVPIKIGDQEFHVSVDTGSSDTWVIQNNFTCIDPGLGTATNPEYCAFGPTFQGTFKHGLVPGVANFSIVYGDGDFVGGQVGYDDVTLAGLTVEKQQLFLGTESMWQAGDNITSGLLGLSYPLETRVFNSSSSPADNYPGSPTHRRYDPVFTSMHKKGLVSPLFSLAMDRKSQNGWLAFGGLPPVDHEPEGAATPIRIVEVDNIEATKSENSFYTIVPDGFVFGDFNTSSFAYSNPSWTASFNGSNDSQFPVIIDSGTTFAYLPRQIVLNYAVQFDAPVGRFAGNYWAPCNSTVPRFGVSVGGTTLFLDPANLLQQEITQTRDYQGSPVNLCLIGLMDNIPDGPYILGDVFLNNFVSVFDVGQSEMRFYKRK